MALMQKIIGYVTGYGAEVDSNNQLKVGLATTASATGRVRMMLEQDAGVMTGVVRLESPEGDQDTRLRVSQDQMLDDELFNYTAQNTGKHTIVAAATNLAPTWTASGYNTNPTSILTTASGATLQTYAFFSLFGTATLSCECEISFNAQPQSNNVIDFGFFQGAASNPFAPTDGAYFRLDAAGLKGVICYNGNETAIGPFPIAGGAGVWTYVNSRKYQLSIDVTTRDVTFWLNDPSNPGFQMLGYIPCPDAQGTPYMSTSQPFRIRHAIVGGASPSALSATLSRYSIRLGGIGAPETLSVISNRTLRGYEGKSGDATLGSAPFIAGIIQYGAIYNLVAGVPQNTVGTCGTGLGGVVLETCTLAAGTNGTDGILMSYQVPAATANIQGRRLKISGISLSSYVLNGPVLTSNATAGYCAFYQLAYGHTAVSLQTAESATAKAPRRVILPFVQQVAQTGTQGIYTILTQNISTMQFINPIYVNPGEFVALVTQHRGIAGTCGTVQHNIQYDFGWE